MVEETAGHCPDAQLRGDGPVDVDYVDYSQGQVQDDAADEHGQQRTNQADVRGREAVATRVLSFTSRSRSRLRRIRGGDVKTVKKANRGAQLRAAVRVRGDVS